MATQVPQVYTTAQFVRAVSDGGEWQERPASVAHGKEMGTTVTLCGLPASSWRRLWSLPYASAPGPRCRACDAVLTATTGRPPSA